MFHPCCVTYQCAWTLGYGSEQDRPDCSGFIVDRREAKNGEMHWYAIRTKQGTYQRNSPTLDRMCDDLGEVLFHMRRDGYIVATWQS